MLVNQPTASMCACLTNRYLPGFLASFLIAISLICAGCGGKTGKHDEKSATTAPVYIGQIEVVNRESHFVLIDLSGTATAPEPGTPLTAISSSGEAVRLKVTPERKRPFVSADIVSGEPKRGQRVYR